MTLREAIEQNDVVSLDDLLLEEPNRIEGDASHASVMYDKAFLEEKKNGFHEIEAFFEQVKKGVLPIYDFEKAKRILELIDAI